MMAAYVIMRQYLRRVYSIRKLEYLAIAKVMKCHLVALSMRPLLLGLITMKSLRYSRNGQMLLSLMPN